MIIIAPNLLTYTCIHLLPYYYSYINTHTHITHIHLLGSMLEPTVSTFNFQEAISFWTMVYMRIWKLCWESTASFLAWIEWTLNNPSLDWLHSTTCMLTSLGCHWLNLEHHKTDAQGTCRRPCNTF